MIPSFYSIGHRASRIGIGIGIGIGIATVARPRPYDLGALVRGNVTCPMKLDRAHIDHVAQLASLSLTDAEAAKMSEELGKILRFVEELAELDTSNVEPTASVQLARTAWREDTPEAGLSHEDALARAPRTADGGFAVPAFVEGPP